MKIVMPNWRPWPQVNVGGLRHFGHLLALGLAGITLLYAEYAVAKPVAAWHLIDLLSEGLAVLMLSVWLVQLRASRPEGHVTTLLCLGLASLLAGSWTDLMDEFWKVPHQVVWLWGLESSLNLLGMGLLTWGLQQWRGEQLALNQQQQRRERLFREHRSVDALTQLGDASYMQAQLLRERAAGHPGQLLMLAWPGLEAVQREQGLVAAEKLLQEAAQMLLLYLQPDELLCRYAAQHWLVLLPERSGPAARERSALLLQALQLFAQARAPKAPRPQGVSAEVLSPLSPDALMLSLLQTLENNEART